jgi:hypothetical protein
VWRAAAGLASTLPEFGPASGGRSADLDRPEAEALERLDLLAQSQRSSSWSREAL